MNIKYAHDNAGNVTQNAKMKTRNDYHKTVLFCFQKGPPRGVRIVVILVRR